MIGPFTRPQGVNPIITPNPKGLFQDPMSGKTVLWEEMATFNPAAVVRDGTVYVLYRAEDTSGEMEIGGHTSRIGMAQSADGLQFNRWAEPILFPDNDAQKENEWPGGVEDPRIVEAEDGTYILTYTQWNRKIPQLALATSSDLGRTDQPFIKPEMEYERTGQYEDGTTFLEGLVPFKGRWFLYYGTADSRVAVVVAER